MAKVQRASDASACAHAEAGWAAQKSEDDQRSVLLLPGTDRAL